MDLHKKALSHQFFPFSTIVSTIKNHPKNVLLDASLIINHHGLDFLMAALFKLDNDEEEFLAFDIQHQ